MRTILAILVLLIIPLQLAFAAASEYCDMGMGDTGHHFGHHTHFAGKIHADLSKKADNDGGCGYCQLGCAHAQISQFAFEPPAIIATFDIVEQPLPAAFSPPPFDRPPRAALA